MNKLNSKSKLKLELLAVAALAMAACGAPPEEESPDAEGCEHLENGPAVAVIDSMGSPPKVGSDHRRHDIPLTAGNPSATVEFAVSEAGDYLFFLDRDVPLTIKQGGSAISFEETAKSSTECDVVAGRHLVPLEVGTATLEFGETTETSVGLVIEPFAHGHEE